MRRLEVERIDDKGRRATAGVADTGRARHPPGLGPEMRPRGLSFRPPTRVDGLRREPQVWCGACAPCLARTAPGGVGAPPGWVLRPAREELADLRRKCLMRSAARRRVVVSRETMARPQVERREASAPARCLRRLRKLVCVARAAQAASGCACRRSAPLTLRRGA